MTFSKLTLDVTEWYSVSIAAVAVCLFLLRIISLAPKWINSFQGWVLRKVVYPRLVLRLIPIPLVVRRYSAKFTRLLFSVMGSYTIMNGVCMGLGIRRASLMSDLMIRSGVMASINMIPLFMGGRTSTLANFLGISLHTYYIAHHWIGWLVIIQSGLHVALALASRKPWTFDSSQISGITVGSQSTGGKWANSTKSSSALALLILFSLLLIGKMIYEVFLQTHLILAFIFAFALLVHVLPAKPGGVIFPAVALTLWGVNAIWRFGRMAYINTGGRKKPPGVGQATIKHFFKDPAETVVNAMRVTVNLLKPQRMRPGQYAYLHFSDMGTRRRIQSHPYAITWWDDSLSAMSLSFLIQPQSGISADLVGRNSIRTVTFDGPYGNDLQLETYDTVILIAKGIGISGILSHIRHMTYRKTSTHKDHQAYRRGLITRKVDIFWVLEENSQQDWISEWMVDLSDKDSDRLILTFYCFYPFKKTKPPPVPPDVHWNFIYEQEPLPIITTLMVKEIQRSPGKSKVAVCGTAEFSRDIRSIVLKTMDEYRDVEFVETEFQPQTVQPAYPGIHVLNRGEMELEQFSVVKTADGRARLRKAKRSSREEEINRRLVRAHSGTTTKLMTVDEEKVEEVEEEQDLEAQSVGSRVSEREIV